MRHGLLAIVVLTTVLRLVLGACCFGFWTGDDVEILQRAFADAVGLGYVPWQIRHLLLPDLLVAPCIWLAAAAGVRSTSALVWTARLPFALLASLNIGLVFRLAGRWGPGSRSALLAASLYGLHWLPLAYGSTVYPRTVTTTCVLAAALLVTDPRRGRLRPLLAGVAIAVAFACRFSEVMFLAPCCGTILLEDRTRPERAGRCALVLAGCLISAALIVGVVDLATWGRPFASLRHFASFTLVERASSSAVACQPWWFYLWRLPKWLPPTLWPLVLGAAWSRRSRGPLLFVIAPLVVLSAVHHKELRYLQGVMPFVAMAAAATATRWWRRGRRAVTATLLVTAAGWGVCGVGFLRSTSMAAVLAARDLARDRPPQRVALTQSWAFGGRLWLRQAVVRDLPVRPTVPELAAVVPRVTTVALYEDVVRDQPELALWLAGHGFREAHRYRYLRSRPVVVYRHRPPATAAVIDYREE